jgi:hypothetical protein
LNFEIKGVAPLIMHNGQTADPLSKFSKMIKQISSKRNKTDADYEELARLEWYAGLYLQDGKPCIPGEVLEATFSNSAKRRKLGKQAQAGLICAGNYQLIYEGPDDVNVLWENHAFRLTVGVRIKGNRIMRTRPIFRKWASQIEVQFDSSMLNGSQVEEIVRIAGEEVGLMDWRPKFGRFEVVG